jgi:hypothetical protein
MSEISRPTMINDFAFFYGRWRVINRRLTQRLQGSDAWETFEAEQRCVPLMDGIGNTDEMRSLSGDIIGISIRLFNLQARTWSIYWVSPRDGVLQPPVVGSFTNKVGVFIGADTFAGAPITVRYTWSRTDTPAPRWEQEFSSDGGRTWEKNWVMDFSRLDAPDDQPALWPAGRPGF